MKSEKLLDVSERILHGIRDTETVRHDFEVLWRYPLVLESLILMLRSHDETHHKNFEIICNFMCPEFLSVVDKF